MHVLQFTVQVEHFGIQSPAMQRFKTVVSHHLSCSRGFRDLNPKAWSERHSYDMETLGPVRSDRVSTES